MDKSIAALAVIPVDQGRVKGAGGSVQAWAAHSFCMSVSFHNSSAKRDCQESLQLQRSIRTCQPAITAERWGSGIRIPLAPSAPALPPSRAGQPASTLFGSQRDNKTISMNQKQLQIPLQPLSLPLPSRGICGCIKDTLTDITFLMWPFTFFPPKWNISGPFNFVAPSHQPFSLVPWKQ